ncbi:hypothetical protein [Oceanobacillus alkalisoli]|uniref:hypothetical protein n=1 Tax=Oceanobacillus alkalisoli TaxID=2925113 RepID=UPI001EE48876|nr:hypothetical protein [Oceanobacillus alkalisoli]MCG5102602.1 hypothetical protein [Oceanobacillus alkalisoli]
MAQLVIYSENIANFIVIALGVALYYVRYINGQKLILNPAILVLLISSLTLGRTAIVASLLLLGIVIYFKYKWNFKYFLLLILIFMFYSDRVINSILTIIQNLGSKFGERTSFAEDVRYTIWADYMEKIDLTRLLLGFNEAETHYFMGFTNPHNSFLSGHYTLGFFMIVIIMLIIYILIKLSIYRHSFIALLLVVLLVRSSTDMVIFTGNFDFIYISILLYGYFLMKGELKLE